MLLASQGEVGGFGGTLSKIEVKVRMAHEGEVNRARVMPQNNFMIGTFCSSLICVRVFSTNTSSPCCSLLFACLLTYLLTNYPFTYRHRVSCVAAATKAPSSNVYVFDYSKHSSMPTDDICKPNVRCIGHESEGYGLSWNPHTKGQLLSGSDDAYICIWDIAKGGDEVQAIFKQKGHTDIVEDVDWHKFYAHLFGSVGDDSQLLLWDSRDASGKPTDRYDLLSLLLELYLTSIFYRIAKAHESDVNCLSFNPFNEYLLATGGSDNVVALWDLRNLKETLHTFKGHQSGVYQVSWAPFNETILGSSSSDR